VDDRLGIGVDIGATRVRVCVGDAKGKFLWRESRIIPLPQRAEEYVEEILTLVRKAAKQVPGRAGPAGVGVASVGPLDLERGGMDSPANLPYGFVPIVGPLAESLGTEVTLMNDASAAALGESRFGAGKGCDNLVYVTLSTGIGGGAMVDGHLLSGKDGNAAEIGHVMVDPSGRLQCGCGGMGHWEAYCSGKSIPRFAELLAAEDGGPKEVAKDAKSVDSAAIFRAAARRSAAAMRVVKEVGRLNAVGVANAVNMFDPSLVTIGGGVALNNPAAVLGPIRRLVPKLSINGAPRIMITPLGDDAGLLGALSLAFGEPAP